MYYTARWKALGRFSQRVFVWLQIPVTLLDTGMERESERETNKKRGREARAEEETEEEREKKEVRGCYRKMRMKHEPER